MINSQFAVTNFQFAVICLQSAVMDEQISLLCNDVQSWIMSQNKGRDFYGFWFLLAEYVIRIWILEHKGNIKSISFDVSFNSIDHFKSNFNVKSFKIILVIYHPASIVEFNDFKIGFLNGYLYVLSRILW